VPGLNYEQMKEASQAFNEAFEHTMVGHAPEEIVTLSAMVASIVVTQKSYLLVTIEGLANARDLVFKNAKFCDFVLSVWFVFASRWAHSDETITALAENLARGCTQGSMESRRVQAIPEDYKTRFSSLEEAKGILSANPWMMVLLMFSLSLKITSQVKGRRAQPQQ
jgi:hypothetical protein